MIYSGPQEISYLFVDGGALREYIKNLSKKYFGEQPFEIDFNALKRGFTKAFYYDALPVREGGESEEVYNERIASQKAILDTAAATDGVHVYEGDARRRKKRGLEQKKVDVMLTVDMLTHAFRRNMHKATLLTGDVDFKPLVDALVQDGMYISVWYPVGETSLELLNAADARRPLTLQSLRGIFTQDSRDRFQTPQMLNLPPAEIVPGDKLVDWVQGGKHHELYKNWSGQQQYEYIVTREGDHLNKLRVWHENFEFLDFFCRTDVDIKIPAFEGHPLT